MAVLIVVSGVLVLVALVFLIIGLLGEGLTMIWLSIGTSAVAAVFLLLGALQRRGAAAPAAESGSTSGDMLERVTAVSVRPRETEATAEVPTPAIAAEPASVGGQVSIVPGRPRYHVASCRFLAGRPDVETIDVDAARSEGYTACGVCKPDASLEAAMVPVEAEPAAAEPMMEEPVEEAKPAKKTAAKKAATKTAAATKAPAKATKTAAAPAKAAAKAAPAKAAAKAAPAKAAPAKAAPAKAAAKATSGGSVVVIPDRGKYHNDACRFVKDVPGTVTLTKANAKKQGYVACGVCKPG